jgi:hypothetical protein
MYLVLQKFHDVDGEIDDISYFMYFDDMPEMKSAFDEGTITDESDVFILTMTPMGKKEKVWIGNVTQIIAAYDSASEKYEYISSETKWQDYCTPPKVGDRKGLKKSTHIDNIPEKSDDILDLYLAGTITKDEMDKRLKATKVSKASKRTG